MFYRSAIIPLIEEIARFLPIVDVDIKLKPILSYKNSGVERFRKKTFSLLKSLEFPYGHIISLINTLGVKKGIQSIDNMLFPNVHSQRKSLDNKVIIEFINN